MLRTNSFLGIMVSLVFVFGSSISTTDKAYATPPDCFLNVDATAGTCWTSPTDFLGGTGIGNCRVTPNGNVNCNCSGDLLSVVIPDDCPPDPSNPNGIPGNNKPAGNSNPFDSCGTIIGNHTDLCCITGTGVGQYSTLVTTNNSSNATPSGKLHFQCHTGGGRPAPDPG